MNINPVMASGAAASSGASGVNQSANNAEATFLKLLITELQSQDPTSPMDPTQMVGQMFSMNQLNELIAINQTLQNAFGSAGTSTPSNTATTNSVTGAH